MNEYVDKLKKICYNISIINDIERLGKSMRIIEDKTYRPKYDYKKERQCICEKCHSIFAHTVSDIKPGRKKIKDKTTYYSSYYGYGMSRGSSVTEDAIWEDIDCIECPVCGNVIEVDRSNFIYIEPKKITPEQQKQFEEGKKLRELAEQGRSARDMECAKNGRKFIFNTIVFCGLGIVAIAAILLVISL